MMNNKKKKWILGATSLAIALVILTVTMGNTILARVAPDKYVLLSLLEMQKAVEKNKLPDSKNKERKMALNLKEITGIYDDYKDMIEGWGMFFSVANSNNGDVKIDTGLQNSGVNLMDLSIYSSASQLGIKIPGLLDQYVMVNLQDFKDQYDHSILSRYFGNIESEDINLLDRSISLTKMSLQGEVLGSDTSLNKDLQELMTELATNMAVKHTGQTKVLIANKQKRANTFLLTIEAKELKNLVKSAAKIILNDPDIKNTSLAFQNYFEIDSLEESVYDTIDQIKFSDVEISLAIDHKKHMTNIGLLTSVEMDNEQMTIKSNYNLSGGENILNTLDANLLLESRGRSLEASLTKDLETKEDNFALTSHINIANNTNLSFQLLGDLVADNVDLTRRLDANKIELKAEGFGNAIYILASGAFEIENLKESSIVLAEEQLLDLFSLGPIQILDILRRLGVQFYNVGKILNVL